MFFNRKFGKLFWISVLLCISCSIAAAQTRTSNFYAVVKDVKTPENKRPLLYYDINPIEINLNDKIYAGSTILTREHQTMEIVIYNESKEIGIITIKENTDFRFQLNDLKTVLDIRLVYGGIRAVIDEGILAVINSQTIKTAIYGADFGLLSVADDKGTRKGYAIVFGGEILLASQLDTENPETVRDMQICEFIDYKILKPRYFKIEEFTDWKKNMLFKTQSVPQNLALALEKLNLEEKDIPKSDEEVLREEIVKEEEKKTDLTRILSSLLSFKAGTLSLNNSIGLQLVHNPSINLLNERLELGLYFSLNLIPSKIFTSQAMLKINNSNNEWSFGSDQNSNPKAVVYDVFSDLLLKIGLIRYNHDYDNIFVQVGNYNNVSDYLSYSLVDYNTAVYYPKFRKTSFISRISLTWFESLIYAEEIMPSGLYGADFIFMTPAKSFRFKFRISGYVDCYDLIKFNETESFFPGQFNTTFAYDTFNVPSFGFSLFLSGGIYLPFTYNFTTGQSLFQDLITQNPAALADNLSGNTGFNLRIINFSFLGAFIFDSGLNKIGLFDPLYMAKRDYHAQQIREWMTDLSSRVISIDDFNFGAQVQFGYDLKRYITFELNYKITFPRYYDRIYFKLKLDSVDKWKVNLAFYALWCLESIGISFQSLKTLQENNIFFTGFTIRPHKTTEINLALGIIPDYVTYSDPWYSQFMLDLNIVIKPLYALPKNKDTDVKNINP